MIKIKIIKKERLKKGKKEETIIKR